MTRPTPTGRALFAAIAPRLERAHRERTEARARLRVERGVLVGVVLDAEWRFAHRELQLLRADAGYNKRRYIAERQRKLEDAKARLDRARARLVDCDQRLRAA